jgi:hypothetical protein
VTRIIDIEEVAGWLEHRGLRGPKCFDQVEEVARDRLALVRRFDVPNDGRVLLLADAIAGFFTDSDEVLVCVDDWPPELADYNLFDRFRLGLGETAHVSEKPGHLFYPDDRADMLSLVRLVLCFDWDAYLISSFGRLGASRTGNGLARVTLDRAEPDSEVQQGPLPCWRGSVARCGFGALARRAVGLAATHSE